MAKKLKSVLTGDMDTCYITGYQGRVERHHVFGGPYKKASEKYGFIVPLRPDLHPNGANCTWSKEIRLLDLQLKKECQRYFEEHLGTREDFRSVFGKSYL